MLHTVNKLMMHITLFFPRPAPTHRRNRGRGASRNRGGNTPDRADGSTIAAGMVCMHRGEMPGADECDDM